MLMLLFVACNSEEPKATPSTQTPVSVKKSEAIEKKGVTNISWEEAIHLQKEGALFLDVRNPQELTEGYVAGALNIPLPELQQRLSELPMDKKLMVYCRSGHRSQTASNMLVANGFSHVYNIEGGFMAAPPSSALPRAK
jgi:rhodanese-related sulfurtransferase